MARVESRTLKRMSRDRALVRFSRRFKEFAVRGYVLDVGPTFFLLALVSDRIRFDGFECFRIADIRNLTLDPYAAFAEAALKKRRDRLPANPKVDVGGIKELLLSASRAFPLVTIHLERVDPEICWIGRIVDIDRVGVSLLEINPDATWDDDPTRFRLNEITRVSFGGDYEGALHLVGGKPGKGSR